MWNGNCLISVSIHLSFTEKKKQNQIWFWIDHANLVSVLFFGVVVIVVGGSSVNLLILCFPPNELLYSFDVIIYCLCLCLLMLVVWSTMKIGNLVSYIYIEREREKRRESSLRFFLYVLSSLMIKIGIKLVFTL